MSFVASQSEKQQLCFPEINTLSSSSSNSENLQQKKILKKKNCKEKSKKQRENSNLSLKKCDENLKKNSKGTKLFDRLTEINHFVKEDISNNGTESHKKDTKSVEILGNQSIIDDSVYNFIFTRNFFKLASSVGIMLGLGNIWRFPMVVYENGGGTFIVVYLILCVIIGFPAAYMEGILGQFSKSPPSFAFNKIVPIMKGLGWTGVMINMLMTAIYGVILSWITVYCGISLISKHRFIFSCKNSHNTKNCFSIYDNKDCFNNLHSELKINLEYNNTYFLPNGYQGGTCVFSKIDDQITDVVRLHYTNESYQSAAKEFFERLLLDKTDNVNKVGDLNGTLVTTLAIILAFTCSIIVLNSNKYKYFSNAVSVASSFATFLFMTQTLTMSGSQIALSQYFFNFNYIDFLSAKTWVNAAAQLCYSLSIAEGSYINLTSKNKKKSNIFKETIVIMICDIAMSLTCTLAVFSVTGHLAYKYKLTNIRDLVDYGAMLLFVAIPEGVSENFAGNVYMLIFFSFTFVLVQSSLAYYIESNVCCFMDQFKMDISRRSSIIKLIVIALFILSLPMTFGNGIYWIVAFDDATTTSLPILALIEIGAISYFYGIDRWMLDIKTVFKNEGVNHSKIYGSSGAIIRYLWKYITPMSLFFVCIGAIYKIINGPFKIGEYEMPNHVAIIGWIVGLTPFSFTFGFAFFILLKSIVTKNKIPKLVDVKPDWPTYNEDYQSKTKYEINIQRRNLDDIN
ncbi:Sodium-dependent dopamine transporter [Strongyloides ratti]|uniref:Sodium-dependent dopamine transporter n=1 Tax=Strongyloides ratti TaxID=34506 RepID=A0A090LDX8_STRRB|nr:Sodium-dependent dopamine transporter [Strongyloides ratti]CEF66343.1 Sodium-dependent dopamine transporter [Strongyloides ratti]